MNRILLGMLIATGTLLLQGSACVSPKTDVRGSDDGAFFPALRGTWVRPSGWLGDVDVSVSNGSFTQNVLSGETVEIEISGIGTLRNQVVAE